MELNIEQIPAFIFEGNRILSNKKDDPASSITVSELEIILKSALFEVLSSLKQPEELIRIYTREQTAEILGISLPTLDKLVEIGSINSRRLGRKVYFLTEDVLTALKKA